MLLPRAFLAFPRYTIRVYFKKILRPTSSAIDVKEHKLAGEFPMIWQLGMRIVSSKINLRSDTICAKRKWLIQSRLASSELIHRFAVEVSINFCCRETSRFVLRRPRARRRLRASGAASSHVCAFFLLSPLLFLLSSRPRKIIAHRRK